MSNSADYDELYIDSMPFYIGLQGSKDAVDLPKTLPFTLAYDSSNDLIVQKYNENVDYYLSKAYSIGSSLSTPLGEGTFGNRHAHDIIKAIKKSILPKKSNDLTFMEIGCNNGYLLSLLNNEGALKCVGVEPDPISTTIEAKHDIQIINDFFNSNFIDEKFDVVYTRGVLEHIEKPLLFLEDVISSIKDKGILFTAVPDCRYSLSIGDISIPMHEHYNYFTSKSLYKLYKRLSIDNIHLQRSEYGWFLYIWGNVNHNKRNIFKIQDKADSEIYLYKKYIEMYKRNIEQIQRCIELLECKQKNIGIYGASSKMLMFKWESVPKFFDTDVAKHGKYFFGFENAIGSPANLRDENVDSIIVTPINHDSEIKEYLRNELYYSGEIISLKDIYMRSH